MICQKKRSKKWIVVLFMVAATCLVVTGCGTRQTPVRKPGTPKPYKVWGKWYHPIPDARGFSQKGIASWYGKKFHGRKTSNGETYNMYAETAAHKTLPFGTVVRVENLDNGKETVVRINDRGPFVSGRIIDLSYKAGKKVGIDITGTARVRITALESDSDGRKNLKKGNFSIQVGAFGEKQNADRLAQTLRKNFSGVHLHPFDRGDRRFWRVRVGAYKTLKAAEKGERRLRRAGYPAAMAVGE